LIPTTAFRYGYRYKRTAAGRRFALRVLMADPLCHRGGGLMACARARVR
jgi:hypothetical protein